MTTLDKSTVTFCTGFWHIRNNRKNSLDHYLKFIPRTCKLIRGNNLIVFYEEDGIFEFFDKISRKYRINIRGIKTNVSDLPAYKHSDEFLASCKATDLQELSDISTDIEKEKGYVHYWREYKLSGEDSYKKIISIWMSKIPLVADIAMSANPFGTEYFAWIDASVSRANKHRDNWDFMKLDYGPRKFHHYKGRMNYMGRPLRISASLLIAEAEAWKHVNAQFEKQLIRALPDHYAHDEETLLNKVLQENPEWFKSIEAMSPVSHRALFPKLSPFFKSPQRN